MARQMTHTIATNGGSTEPATRNPDDNKIEALAYLHWLDRGCPIGSPEEDWFQAQKELNDRKGYVQTAA